MGYDFLGTMNLTQWSKIKGFTENTVAEVCPNLEPLEGGGTGLVDTPYSRHLKAERAKFIKTQAQIDECTQTFNGFKGDYDFLKEEEPTNANIRMNYDDAAAGTLVARMKEFQLPQLKRHKDNLEYRFKKFIDLEDQYDNRIARNASFESELKTYTESVNAMFSNPQYQHNLKRVEGTTNLYTNHETSYSEVTYRNSPTEPSNQVKRTK